MPQFTLHLRTTPQAITIAINYGYPDIRSLPATTGTQKPSDLYNSPGRSMTDVSFHRTFQSVW
ncbi:hypothetical protein NXW10_19285 [Bacteroides fragilis]|nr:hypothetical protein NXW10_19285 [Bacteroides fragilis]